MQEVQERQGRSSRPNDGARAPTGADEASKDRPPGAPAAHTVRPAAAAADGAARLAEARLLEAISEGDQASFALLYEQLSQSVYRLALRVVVDAHLAEECTQDVFWHVWRHASDFNAAQGSARTWVLVIAHRRAVDRVRREQSSRVRDDRYAQRTNRSTMSTFEDESVIRLDTETGWGRLVSGRPAITEAQRQAIGLAYFEAMTHREIAAYLNVPLGTVKTRIRDGLVRLRVSLPNPSGEEDAQRPAEGDALAANLRDAADARIGVEQAKGRLAATYGVSIEVAAQMLEGARQPGPTQAAVNPEAVALEQ